MLIKYWLALLIERNDMLPRLLKCFHGALNAVHRAWCPVHFLDVYGFFQIYGVCKNKSSWNAAWDMKLKRRWNNNAWNRWIRKQEHLPLRLKEQPCDCSTPPRPFWSDYLPCWFSVVIPSLVKAMHLRSPARIARFFQHQLGLYRPPFPAIRVIRWE